MSIDLYYRYVRDGDRISKAVMVGEGLHMERGQRQPLANGHLSTVYKVNMVSFGLKYVRFGRNVKLIRYLLVLRKKFPVILNRDSSCPNTLFANAYTDDKPIWLTEQSV